MRIFDPEKAIVIQTDVSDHMITGIMSQDEQSLDFISQKINPVEQNYTISEKEIIAVIQAIKEWRKYLEGGITENKMITDHKNLIYFKET